MKFAKNIIFITLVMLLSSLAVANENTVLTNVEPPTITITNPSVGQDYCLNEQLVIEWQTSGGTVASISIYLTDATGQTTEATVANDIPNSGQYLWNPNISTEGDYRIRIEGTTSMTSEDIKAHTGAFMLKDCLKPDLALGTMGAVPPNDEAIGEGQRIIYRATVRNIGESTVTNPTIKLVLDRPGDGPKTQFTTTMNVTIDPDQSATFQKGFRVEGPGTYAVTIILDHTNSLDELNENNNRRTRSFNVYPLPDLIVYISNGKRPPLGRDREIRIVVKNVGNEATNPNANFRLRSYVKQKGVKYYDVPVLQPGETHTIKRNHRWGTAGTKKVNARISYSKTEINKDNNFIEGSFFVRLPHHDKYSAAPPIKCSTGETFWSWDNIENEMQ